MQWCIEILTSPTPLNNTEEIIVLLNKNENGIEVKSNDINSLKNQIDLLNKSKQKQNIKMPCQHMRFFFVSRTVHQQSTSLTYYER